MKKLLQTGIFLCCLCGSLYGTEVVVLLHGLVRSASSMGKMERHLSEEGYDVININYPSRKFTIEELSEQVRESIAESNSDAEKIHFVTHSMGGILIRYIQAHFPFDNIGRVVMLSPPNKGSEVVDFLSGISLYKQINGPAGMQLGTDQDSLPADLGAVEFELGIITGDRSINWMNSFIIPGKDDGKVSVDSAKLVGMKSFKVVHATHAFIMLRSSVIRDVIEFLKSGEFTDESY